MIYFQFKKLVFFSQTDCDRFLHERQRLELRLQVLVQADDLHAARRLGPHQKRLRPLHGVSLRIVDFV